jgi:hypothetical protein
LTPFRVTNHVTPDGTPSTVSARVLQPVLQLIDESHQRAGHRRGVFRGPGSPNSHGDAVGVRRTEQRCQQHEEPGPG